VANEQMLSSKRVLMSGSLRIIVGFCQGEHFTGTCNGLCSQLALKRLADVTTPVLGCLLTRDARCFHLCGFGSGQLSLRETFPASP
jgi:hypothetical protein